MKRIFAPLLIALGFSFGSIGLGLAGKAITMKGSDTMVILGQRWAEQYMQKTAGAVIQVTGGGSGTGIAALINGTTDICQASRPMKPSEKTKLKERYFTQGIELPVAKDGLAVYLHESNPVEKLSLEQLKAIYTGQVTNWKQVGGPDAKIILYGRENNSGTYVFFKDKVLMGADFAPQTATLPGTAAVVNAVAKDKLGIGYGGAAYAKGIKFCKVSEKTDGEAFGPDLEHVENGKYPLARDLYWYFRTKPAGDIKKLVDWVLSPEGQKVVSEVGYFPVKSAKTSADAEK
ncbi:MAG: phosphate ABC transporter substrate-binding protein [candidate division Zixibacteria bacterium]|nr:phosphate ABC transporter substrate-binding protein [candidate division Zixibacteria bacterium]MCI0595728.1 phosphate ABC transporter substrate-binding protein [candidate division Zixibacteria bacterium]